MSQKILINTGPSPRGWHRLEAFLRCPQLYAWGYGQGGSNPERAARFALTPPLVRGSLGHAGLAHTYARLYAAQWNADPDKYYKPLEAMDRVAAEFGDLGREMLPIASAAVRRYVERFGHERWEIVGVEKLEETEFLGYRYTARVDLEYRDRSGKIWFMDHKFVGKIEAKVQRRYAMSGQVLGLWHLGARKHGTAFGGVQMNLVGCNDDSFLRFVPEPAPFMLQKFPSVVAAAEVGIELLETEINDGTPIPASPSEFTCMTSYGECPAFELCRWGAPQEAAPIQIGDVDIYAGGQ